MSAIVAILMNPIFGLPRRWTFKQEPLVSNHFSAYLNINYYRVAVFSFRIFFNVHFYLKALAKRNIFSAAFSH